MTTANKKNLEIAISELAENAKRDDFLGKWAQAINEYMISRNGSVRKGLIDFQESSDFFQINGKFYGVSKRFRIYKMQLQD